MARSVIFILLCLLVCFLAGCRNQPEPVWSDTKITDLAPADFPDRTEKQFLVNLKAYIFQVPADKIEVLTNLKQILTYEPLEFANYKSFQANSFYAGLGRDEMWIAVLNILEKSDAKKLETISFLLSADQPDDMTVYKIYEGDNIIYYVSKSTQMESIQVNPGQVALRINIKKIPDSKGLCRVTFTPVFLPFLEGISPKSSESENYGGFIFKSGAFRLKLSPGSFVLIAPDKGIDNQVTLGGRFFAGPSGFTKLYLITCIGIKD